MHKPNKCSHSVTAMTSKLQDARFSVIIVAEQGLKQYFQTIVTQNTLAWHSHVTLLLMNAKEIQNAENIVKACVARITVPNTIIFFTDIRVQLPLKVLEHVRKVSSGGCMTKFAKVKDGVNPPPPTYPTSSR